MASDLTMASTVFACSTETGFIFDSAPGAFCREEFHCRDCLFDSKAVAQRAGFFRRWRCCILVFTAFVAVHFIQACTAGQIKGNSADRLGAEIRLLVNRLAKSPCSLKQVENILTGETSYQQQGRYAIIKSPQHNTIAAIKDAHGENVVTELVIYPQSETNLQFKDLQGLMADCQIVPDRKSSAPVFQRISADRKIIVDVYVTLLFPPTAPKSRVVSIRIQVNSKETSEG
jgi:hypothetical protein